MRSYLRARDLEHLGSVSNRTGRSGLSFYSMPPAQFHLLLLHNHLSRPMESSSLDEDPAVVLHILTTLEIDKI